MNKELEALKTAMDAGDFDTARELATDYVTAHPDEFTEYAANAEQAYSEQEAIEQVVGLVSVFRSQGMLDSQYRAEAWHLHTWEPQQIGGAAGPQRREHSGGSAPKRRIHN